MLPVVMGQLVFIALIRTSILEIIVLFMINLQENFEHIVRRQQTPITTLQR